MTRFPETPDPFGDRLSVVQEPPADDTLRADPTPPRDPVPDPVFIGIGDRNPDRCSLYLRVIVPEKYKRCTLPKGHEGGCRK